MGSQDQNSVIRRKARAARDGADPRLMSPAKALRLSLAQAADTHFDLALNVATVEQMRVPPGEAARSLGEEGLLVLLDGAQGARAALRLDPQFLAALIEVQTMGAVRPGVARVRPATPTDAAMVAPLVDALLERFDERMVEGFEDHVARAFRFGDRVEEPRSLSLVLTDGDYDLFRITVDLGPGAKTGRLDLLLPVALAPPRKADSTRAAHAARGIGEVTLNAPVVLDTVMARVNLTLRDVWAFRPGQIVPLAREALSSAQLVGTGGHLVARVHLGQINGWRAVRLLAAEGGTLAGPAAPESSAEGTQDTTDPQSRGEVGAQIVPYSGPAQVRI
ncbi:flagellar motor switch protein FliM [Roseovarius azorensis]|uniref:Flagellar motor switch protein FliM n=1 Tax=Roseovarius azorensis TaxID=1287727 RepID=A0A1H7U3A5_9RHOB|nr:flagellar motor switch protein FliM [Roseovarius azorensis]SEL90717.1 flagellar motor switch protein FliM [Roseovarius azorensis]